LVARRLQRVEAPLGLRELPSAFKDAVAVEVCCGPKPGLVDPFSPHPNVDMDVLEFSRCLTAFKDCLEEALEMGLEGEGPAALARLIPAWNVDVMTEAGGPNTVRGVLFLGALYCYSAGLSGDPLPFDTVREVAPEIVSEFERCSHTKCGRRRIEEGLPGVLGEALSGFVTVRTVSVPVLVRVLARTGSLGRAVVASTLACMVVIEDAGLSEGERRFVRSMASKAMRGEAELDELVSVFDSVGVKPAAAADVTAVGLAVVGVRYGRDVFSPYRDPERGLGGGEMGEHGEDSGPGGWNEGRGLRG